MAINTKILKVVALILLLPFILVLAIVTLPFALMFGLLRLPFAKRRINKLAEMLKKDWMPRKKYIYVGLNSDSAVSNFLKDKILRDYAEYIVWDEWDAKDNQWIESEPDDSQRVTTFWQDIGGDFDDKMSIIIATYKPDDFVISRDHNFYQFMSYAEDDIYHNDGIYFKDKKLSLEEAKKKIEEIIMNAIDSWR